MECIDLITENSPDIKEKEILFDELVDNVSIELKRKDIPKLIQASERNHHPLISKSKVNKTNLN